MTAEKEEMDVCLLKIRTENDHLLGKGCQLVFSGTAHTGTVIISFYAQVKKGSGQMNESDFSEVIR